MPLGVEEEEDISFTGRTSQGEATPPSFSLYPHPSPHLAIVKQLTEEHNPRITYDGE